MLNVHLIKMVAMMLGDFSEAVAILQDTRWCCFISESMLLKKKVTARMRTSLLIKESRYTERVIPIPLHASYDFVQWKSR